ncbi:hypothetical protein [Ectopseudomonas khazarica]|uniref:hypothetical protein n=1 Tax=Ectopseudomonas khazarica TaxID=2502979 RepID=UPI0037CBFECA
MVQRRWSKNKSVPFFLARFLTKETLNRYVVPFVSIICFLLMAPTTIMYVLASIYILFASSEAPVLLLLIPLGGIGLYSAWSVTIRMEEYAKKEVPIYVCYGIAVGAIAMFIVWLFLGILSGWLSFQSKSYLESIYLIVVTGVGPLITSCLSLLTIKFKARKQQL